MIFGTIRQFMLEAKSDARDFIVTLTPSFMEIALELIPVNDVATFVVNKPSFLHIFDVKIFACDP